MRSIGIDIGDYSVKIVELVQNKKSVFINQYQEKILSQNVSKEDKELEVIEFIRNFASSGDYSQARWIAGLRQGHATTRFKTFPFSDKLKIQKSLPFEMEEDIPFDTDNCIFDAKVIKYHGPSADILATAVPKNHIEELVELSSNFGVEISAVSLEGLAFANLIENWENPPPAVPDQIEMDAPKTDERRYIQVILNIGHRNTLFAAFENNRLIFTRSLYWGASQLIQEIIKKNSISYVEAVKVLQSQGMILLSKENASNDQSQISALITKSIKELSRDIQMTILELQSDFNAEVSAVHFTGGLSLLPNLGAYLTQNLEIACNPIQLLQNYTAALAQSGQQLAQVEARFTTAVSLALEGFKKPRNPPTNLLKGDFAKQNAGFKNLWENYGGLIQVTFFGLVAFFVWTSMRDAFAVSLNEKGADAVSVQAKSVARLPKKQANEKGVRKFIKENKKRINELKLVSQVADMNSALDILKKVSDSAPDKTQIKVDVIRFKVDNSVVQIAGYASNAQDVSKLSQALKSVSSDGNVVESPSGLTTVANRRAFSLTFNVDRGLVK